MATITRPAVTRAMLAIGRRLQDLRKAVQPRLTQGAVGKKLGKSQDVVSLMERGAQLPTDEELRVLFDLYGVDTTTRLDVLAQIREAKRDAEAWWRTYKSLPRSLLRLIEFEDTASRMALMAGIVPGPFQTPDYMWAIDEHFRQVHGEAVTRHFHEVRQKRQHVLSREPRPVVVDLLLSEAAIRTQMGGPDVMAAQLSHIQDLARWQNITVRVVPFSAGTYVAMSVTTILDFPVKNDSGIVVVDTATGAEFLEEPKEVRDWRQRFDFFAARALSPEQSGELIETAKKEMRS
ncbi:helix-turn-helix domain-containing protein [Kitasatospora sp. NPDC018619]|uniref:helix-turn-helix domain-containing protein n=1 Tax=unclassified Kitasatospora TaxID=2633591 RepID=UPI00378F3FC5